MSQPSSQSESGDLLFDKHLLPYRSNRSQITRNKSELVRPSLLLVQISSTDDSIFILMEEKEYSNEKQLEEDCRRRNATGSTECRERLCNCCGCNFKLCDFAKKGSFYRNAFGPTIDETLLVGYETFCCTCNRQIPRNRQSPNTSSQSVFVIVKQDEQVKPERRLDEEENYTLGGMTSYHSNDNIKNDKVVSKSEETFIDSRYRSAQQSVFDKTAVVQSPCENKKPSYKPTPRPLPSPRYPQVPDVNMTNNYPTSPVSPHSTFFDKTYDSNLNSTVVPRRVSEWQSKQPFPTVEFKDASEPFAPSKSSTPISTNSYSGRASSGRNTSSFVPSCQRSTFLQSNSSNSASSGQGFEEIVGESVPITPSEHSQELQRESETHSDSFSEQYPKYNMVDNYPTKYGALPTIQEEPEECGDESEKSIPKESSSRRPSLIFLYDTRTESSESVIDYPRIPTPRPSPPSEGSSEDTLSNSGGKSVSSGKLNGIKTLSKTSHESENSACCACHSEPRDHSVSHTCQSKSQRIPFQDESILAKEREHFEKSLRESEEKYEEFAKKMQHEYEKLNEKLTKEQEERQRDREELRKEFEQQLQRERELHQSTMKILSQNSIQFQQQLTDASRIAQRRSVEDQRERLLRRSSELDKERRKLIEQERRLEQERQKRIQLQQQMERERRKLLYQKQKSMVTSTPKSYGDDRSEKLIRSVFFDESKPTEKSVRSAPSVRGVRDTYSKSNFEKPEDSPNRSNYTTGESYRYQSDENTGLPQLSTCKNEPNTCDQNIEQSSSCKEYSDDSEKQESPKKPEHEGSTSGKSNLTDRLENMRQRNRLPYDTKYAVTRIRKYGDFKTYEILKTTRTRPKTIPCSPEEVFTVKS